MYHPQIHVGDSEAGCWGLRWVTCDHIPSLVTQSSLLLPLEAEN